MTSFGALKVLVGALGRAGRVRLAVLALLTAGGGVAEYAMLMALLNMLRSWLGPLSFVMSAGAALTFGATVLAAGSIRLAILIATQRFAHDTSHRLLIATQRRVLARPWTAHALARSSGPLAAVEQVDNALYGVLLPLLQAGSALVLGTALLSAMVAIDATTAGLAAGLLALAFVVVTALFRPQVRRAGIALSEGYEARIGAIQQNGGAMRELILAGRRALAVERLQAIDRRLMDARAGIGMALGAPRLLIETLGLLALAGIAWWLAGRSGGLGLALPTLGALALGAQRLLPLAQTLSNAATGLSAHHKLLSDLATTLSEPDLKEGEHGPPLPFEREIRLAGVSFRYAGRDEPAVADLELVIRRGERVALVGRNGSGKSTLADLVMGLLPPQTGEVLIDGVALAGEVVGRWQRNVAHVPQTPFLADASVAENIAFMESNPDHGRIAEAARIAGLHEVVADLPRGYETRIGERGVLLSGGQRQRLALARALYSPAPLLVLDEATSALDPDSERHILEALNALQARGTTILLIAHRPTLLQGCDRLVRLDRGRIVELQAASATS